MIIFVAVASLAINVMYTKRTHQVNPDLNRELDCWNRVSKISDRELLKEYLSYITSVHFFSGH